MGTQWARQQVKRNELLDVFERVAGWIETHRREALYGGGGAVAALLIGGLIFFGQRAKRNAAWDRLAVAQAYAYSGRLDQSLQKVSELAAEAPGTDAASYGLLFAGDVEFQRGRYKEAADNYSAVIAAGKPAPALPLATGDLALALEAGGRKQEAIAEASRFLESYPDHFLAPQVHACLARALTALGRGEEAKTALQKISLQYPDTSWAAWAAARSQAAK